VTEARANRTASELGPLLDAQLGREGVAAIGVYDRDGALGIRAAEHDAAPALPLRIEPDQERIDEAHTGRGAALVVVVPGPLGSVAAVVRTDASSAASLPLVRLVAMYTGIVALGLLTLAYFSMTRLVVQPVEQLSRSARRVADGGRRLEVPRTGARELSELGSSLALMTERLRADEEALRAKIGELETASAELKAAQEHLVRSERLASVGRLAAGLAHEIGNPIAAILGFEELLLAGGLDEAEERDFLERMKRETERIHRVLRDLLDFARPATGVSEADRGPPGDVREAVDDVVALVRPQKSFREVELATDVAPDVPRVGLTQERLVQVLLNLLLNAADAVPRAGGRVAIRAARTRAGGVRIEVEDNGPGIPPAVRATLFEPFVTTKEVGKGTGLGLAVCRGLVEGVLGTITADDASGRGARIVIELPPP
jgi:signal transduction histidine kinase